MAVWIVACVAFVAAAAGGAAACPVCDSATGQEVREGIFDGRFAANFAGVALPAAAVGAVVGVIHFGGRRGKGG